MAIAVSTILFILAAGALILGVLAMSGRLGSRGVVGVRTIETLGNEQAFRLANRIAGPMIVGSSVILALGGVVVLMVGLPLGWIFVVVALVGAVMAAGHGGSVGSRVVLARAAADGSLDASAGCCSEPANQSTPSAGCLDGSAPDERTCGGCALNGMCDGPHQSADREFRSSQAHSSAIPRSR